MLSNTFGKENTPCELHTCCVCLGLGGVPVWVVALTVCLVLILIAGAIATSYYLCFWRGGRMGYRPSRELLNKY